MGWAGSPSWMRRLTCSRMTWGRRGIFPGLLMGRGVGWWIDELLDYRMDGWAGRRLGCADLDRGLDAKFIFSNIMVTIYAETGRVAQEPANPTNPAHEKDWKKCDFWRVDRGIRQIGGQRGAQRRGVTASPARERFTSNLRRWWRTVRGRLRDRRRFPGR